MISLQLTWLSEADGLDILYYIALQLLRRLSLCRASRKLVFAICRVWGRNPSDECVQGKPNELPMEKFKLEQIWHCCSVQLSFCSSSLKLCPCCLNSSSTSCLNMSSRRHHHHDHLRCHHSRSLLNSIHRVQNVLETFYDRH